MCIYIYIYIYIYLFIYYKEFRINERYIYACCCFWFLPYTSMDWPQAYICPLLLNPFPPPCPLHPSRLSQSTGFGFPLNSHWLFSERGLENESGSVNGSVVSNSLRPHGPTMDCNPPGSSVHGASPGKNTGVGCHALLQGIFPTKGLNPGLPHCRQILYCLSHQGAQQLEAFALSTNKQKHSQASISLSVFLRTQIPHDIYLKKKIHIKINSGNGV